MSAAPWDDYPAGYRAREVAAALQAARAGECFAVIGLSGAGKSNLLGFLAARVQAGPRFVLVDCNRLAQPGAPALFALMAEALGGEAGEALSLRALERRLEAALAESAAGVCLLFDRFERLEASADPALAGGLRALRDRFKYRLTFGIGMRRLLDPSNELAELFFGHTLWLGPLEHDDALWSAGRYAARRSLGWDTSILEQIVALSEGYPALLRAVCEAHAAGCPLDLAALRAHSALTRRVAEFWADDPTPEDLRAGGLEGIALLQQEGEPGELTAAEQRLLGALRARPGQVCPKDDLIRAVWPDEVVAGGLRDDSLAQLVHRLREKIEPEPGRPRRIQTVPGRGYRLKE